MNTLELLGKKVNIDTDAIAEGLLKIHEQDEDKKTVLAFGMLDAMIMNCFENNLKLEVNAKFSEGTQELFKERITDFCNDCIHKVSVGIYQRAKMVV